MEEWKETDQDAVKEKTKRETQRRALGNFSDGAVENRSTEPRGIEGTVREENSV